ncbi:MAG: formate--tetrahydrofolate ligase [Thermoplasmatales archaeon]|jgi:formate--tetrahydrofolate ligase|nr:formate--tetrahydrofolate ligase [Candidatus Thermoplasmatota archaeon]MDA8056293.1 formate--tetrahydrofolate ligase [Thermoplasmatales archaeon]
MRYISEIAKELEITDDELELYGKYMAKVNPAILGRLSGRKNGKMILVTAISPTSAGEGKTTTTIGLSQGLRKIGKKAMVTIREPSLGPNFGIKGGGTGGGKCQLYPADEINLNFTGDFPAISAAHNLLSAIVNNHIFQGNELGFDLKKISWKRTIDMNDRSLRQILVGIGDQGGALVEDTFLITPASEIMAIMGFAENYEMLKDMLSKITVGYTKEGKRLTAGDLKAQGAMAALLKNAIKPNLVQTTEGVPGFVHIGPFGNIAHGHNSVLADKIALKLADYVITEAGFGSDLGAQKFVDVVLRRAGYDLNLVVLVVSIKALKHHGGMKPSDTGGIEFLQRGIDNMFYHIGNVERYGLPLIVSLNRFKDDKDEEIQLLMDEVRKKGYKMELNEGYIKGGDGALGLARSAVELLDKSSSTPRKINFTYERDEPVKTKIDKVASKVYGASKIEYSKKAMRVLKRVKDEKLDFLDVCMAKTQYSITDDQSKLGWPKDFTIKIEDIMLSTGVGFAVPLLGEIMTMPGLPKHPISEEVNIDERGNITGLL